MIHVIIQILMYVLLQFYNFVQRVNRPFARWRYFTTTTRLLFVFPFIFKFGNPSEFSMTKA